MKQPFSIGTITLCALLGLISSPASLAKMLDKPTPQEERVILDDMNGIPNNGQLVPCSASSEAALRALWRMGGHHPETSPAPYRTLEKLKASNWQFPNTTATGRPVRYGAPLEAPDAYSLINVDADPAFENVTSMAFSTMYVVDTDDSAYESLSIVVSTKGDDGQMIATGMNDADQSMRYMPVVAEQLQTPNNPTHGDVMAVAYFSGEAGGNPFCWNMRMDRSYAAGVSAINLIAPTFSPRHTKTHQGPDRTIICLNRQLPNSPYQDGCDYGPTSAYDTERNDLPLVFPFGGSIQTLNKIYTVTLKDGRTVPGFPGQPPVPAALHINLVKKEGGACNASFKNVDLTQWEGFNTANDLITWQFVNPKNRADPTNFLSAGTIGQCTDLTSDDVQDWFMSAALTTVNPNNGKPQNYIPVGIGSMSSDKQYKAFKVFPQVGFQWGCVIEGTPVALANGDNLPIEKLKAGDILIGKSGQPVRVTAVTPGHDKQFIKLVSDSGDIVVVTRDHPILTKAGMRRARDLKIGDTVFGRNGPSALREVRTENREKSANVYSLHLAAADGGDIADTSERAFYAGAILVGDYVAQEFVMRQAQEEKIRHTK
jgi:hypothetical protein